MNKYMNGKKYYGLIHKVESNKFPRMKNRSNFSMIPNGITQNTFYKCLNTIKLPT